MKPSLWVPAQDCTDWDDDADVTSLDVSINVAAAAAGKGKGEGRGAFVTWKPAHRACFCRVVNHQYNIPLQVLSSLCLDLP